MGVVWTFFSLSSLFSPSLGDCRYRMKNCLRGPLNPKQPTKIHTGVPWEDHYADDLVIIAELCQKALGMERTNGRERAESKCRKDKDHEQGYRPGPPAEFKRVSMRCPSHWSEQQQHLPQRLLALCAQEMQ